MFLLHRPDMFFDYGLVDHLFFFPERVFCVRVRHPRSLAMIRIESKGAGEKVSSNAR